MLNTKIKVIGVGGGGGNAISRMAAARIQGVELIAINCDIQDLSKAKTYQKLRIGRNLTKGLGAGMDPEVGRLAAEENKEEIRSPKESGRKEIQYKEEDKQEKAKGQEDI